MATYNLPELHGIEPHVVIEPSLQGSRAYGLAFNDGADVIAETDSRQFIDYCHACIAHSIIHELLDSLSTAHAGLYDYLDAAGLPCQCD